MIKAGMRTRTSIYRTFWFWSGTVLSVIASVGIAILLMRHRSIPLWEKGVLLSGLVWMWSAWISALRTMRKLRGKFGESEIAEALDHSAPESMVMRLFEPTRNELLRMRIKRAKGAAVFPALVLIGLGNIIGFIASH